MTQILKELPLLPGSTLGLLGGGQLGRMFSEAAARMGYHVIVLEPHAPSPAGEVSSAELAAAYDDPAGLDELAARVTAVTTEFENVPAGSLKRLAAAGVRAAPHADAVAATQDRNVEKAFIESAGVPTAPHRAIRSEEDLAQVDEGLLPGILKTARLGYDGKGQARVSTKAEVAAAWEAFGRVECVLEKRLALRTEVSVIICRNPAGETAVFPVCENHHRSGILAYTVMPLLRRAPRSTPAGSPTVSTTSASCASSSSCSRTGGSSPTSSRLARTTPATPRSRPAPPRSTSSRSEPWPDSPWATRRSSPRR